MIHRNTGVTYNFELSHLRWGTLWRISRGRFEPIGRGEKFQLMSMIIKDVKLKSSDGLHLINPQEILSLKNNAQLCIKQLLIIQFSEQIFPFLQNYISFTPWPICDIYDWFLPVLWMSNPNVNSCESAGEHHNFPDPDGCKNRPITPRDSFIQTQGQ